MCEISIVELLLCAICPDTFGLASVKSRIIIKDSVSPAPEDFAMRCGSDNVPNHNCYKFQIYVSTYKLRDEG